jgi:hypothetical protein
MDVSGCIMFRRREGIARNNITSVGNGTVLLLVLLTSACDGRHQNAILPTRSDPGAPSVSVSTSAEDAVRQSYSRYWAVLPDAEHADSETRRRQLLADYSTDPQLTTALQGIDDLHGKDLTSSGYVVVHIEKVQLGIDTATVWDCQDATKALIQKRSTRKIISRGVPNDHVQATLSRGSDGRWRISKFAPLSHC